MSKGVLQVSWINRGAQGEATFHLMYGGPGASRTLRARTLLGRENLEDLLRNDLHLSSDVVKRVMSELTSTGAANVPGMDLSHADLRRLELA
jgi:hypothetical protein